MIKSRSFKDTQLLMTMFLNNALKGFLNRPIFKSKWVRRSFVTFLCLLYILYSLYNMKELAKISSIRTNVPLAILETGQKQIFLAISAILLSWVACPSFSLRQPWLWTRRLCISLKLYHFESVIFKGLTLCFVCC